MYNVKRLFMNTQDQLLNPANYEHFEPWNKSEQV